MLVASFATACVVSFVGIVGFVGLVAPHMMRKVGGSAHEYLLPASAAAGAALLLASDLLARLVAAPVVLPVGAIMSFVGAPMFVYLLFREKGRRL